MAEPKGYLIGTGFHEKLKQTIAAVDGMPKGSGGYRLPTDLSGDMPASASASFRIATFTGAWPIGEEKTVSMRSDTASTFLATNLFFPLTANYESATDCAIARDGTAWFLIDVPFETATFVFVGAIGTATSTTFATSQFSYVSGIVTAEVNCITDVSASLNTNNCAITVSKTTSKATRVTEVVTKTASFVQTSGQQTFTIVQSTYTATMLRFRC